VNSSAFLRLLTSHKFDAANLTFLIEANPVNLDPRFATDGQSQRLDKKSWQMICRTCRYGSVT
jgi:hypothetical protein